MIVDTSAVVALVADEPECDAFSTLLERSANAMSAATLLEIEIVVGNKMGEAGLEDARRLLDLYRVVVVPVDEHLARIASAAHRRYGRGSGSPAKLNIGDCFSYALAKHLNEPLLFKGDDFNHTDVQVAEA